MLKVYDIEFRIGQCFGIYPEKVYFHAGTRKGALNAHLTKKYGKENTC